MPNRMTAITTSDDADRHYGKKKEKTPGKGKKRKRSARSTRTT